jgi:hypothetical protein
MFLQSQKQLSVGVFKAVLRPLKICFPERVLYLVSNFHYFLKANKQFPIEIISDKTKSTKLLENYNCRPLKNSPSRETNPCKDMWSKIKRTCTVPVKNLYGKNEDYVYHWYRNRMYRTFMENFAKK